MLTLLSKLLEKNLQLKMLLIFLAALVQEQCKKEENLFKMRVPVGANLRVTEISTFFYKFFHTMPEISIGDKFGTQHV